LGDSLLNCRRRSFVKGRGLLPLNLFNYCLRLVFDADFLGASAAFIAHLLALLHLYSLFDLGLKVAFLYLVHKLLVDRILSLLIK
jgi:hypothetical protein